MDDTHADGTDRQWCQREGREDGRHADGESNGQASVSAFWEAVVAEFRCPRCPAMNRPGATIIKLDAARESAACGQCSYEDKFEKFQAEPRSPA